GLELGSWPHRPCGKRTRRRAGASGRGSGSRWRDGGRMRQVVLDTETTGLEVKKGHRVIEIGCVELLERRPSGRTWHVFLNPDRAIDEGARAVHGIEDGFLRDKPRFRDVVHEFLDFVTGAEIIAHNASFDVAFLNAELNLADPALGVL